MRGSGGPTTAGRAATKREKQELSGQRKEKEKEKEEEEDVASRLWLRRGLPVRQAAVVLAELRCCGDAQLQAVLHVEVGAVGE